MASRSTNQYLLLHCTAQVSGCPEPPAALPGQLSLSDSLGIDIATKLRSHFLANLPAHSYAWLSGVGGQQPPHRPAAPYPWLPAALDTQQPRQTNAFLEKLEKHSLPGSMR